MESILSYNKKNTLNLLRIVRILMFTSMIVVFTIIPPIIIPYFPAPITMQTMAVMLAGLLLSPLDAFLSAFLYIILGAIGLPVFINYTGGINEIFEPTGGFLVSFPFAALCISLTKNYLNYNKKSILLIIIAVFGIFYVYSFSVLWNMFVSDTKFLDLISVYWKYVPGDLLKAILSVIISLKILKFK